MPEATSWEPYGDATPAAAGLFWTSRWAFSLGNRVSTKIQAFAPEDRLTP